MIQRAFTYLGYKYARFQFRKDVDEVLPFTDFFRNARSMLVILPVGYEDAMIAGSLLRDALRGNPLLRVTVVHNSTRETPLGDLPRSEVVRMNPDDLTRFSLPRKPLLQRLLQRQFDVAIDLNLDFILHTAYICKASRAKVRVGRSHEGIDCFYNVQLNFVDAGQPQATYRKFIESIAMF